MIYIYIYDGLGKKSHLVVTTRRFVYTQISTIPVTPKHPKHITSTYTSGKDWHSLPPKNNNNKHHIFINELIIHRSLAQF
jgi:hypothetical protein